ncbi:hypothetical protein L9F63_024065, partial [Diploptera punctata]
FYKSNRTVTLYRDQFQILFGSTYICCYQMYIVIDKYIYIVVERGIRKSSLKVVFHVSLEKSANNFSAFLFTISFSTLRADSLFHGSCYLQFQILWSYNSQQYCRLLVQSSVENMEAHNQSGLVRKYVTLPGCPLRAIATWKTYIKPLKSIDYLKIICYEATDISNFSQLSPVFRIARSYDGASVMAKYLNMKISDKYTLSFSVIPFRNKCQNPKETSFPLHAFGNEIAAPKLLHILYPMLRKIEISE